MKKYTEAKLTQQQKEFLAGCLLGDGNLRIENGCKTACFQCSHGPEQLEYNQYKAKLFENLNAKCYSYTRKKPNKKTGKYYEYNQMYTNNNNELTKMYNNIYKDGKKIITPELLENFTEYSLAILYMDDGYKTVDERKAQKQVSYYISTCCFDENSLKLFQTFLFEKFNIETSIQKSSNKLYIKMNSRNLFEYYIEKYVKQIDCLKYKLRIKTVS
ncbi:MAG: hypothetical protein IJ341_09700 [Bacteroidales bacterium]|nr:hypothetical protein [Bacteroidales bacterium]